MGNIIWTTVVLFCICGFSKATTQDWIGCYSPQYLEMGERGYIRCKFPVNFNALYWYENATEDNANPVLSYTHRSKSGSKYETGEYDILTNGTLVVVNASIRHERVFKVLCIDAGYRNHIFHVSINIKIFSRHTGLEIMACRDSDVCFLDAKQAWPVSCSCKGTRPPVRLAWFERLDNRDEAINSSTLIFSDSSLTFTTTTTVSYPLIDRSLVLLVCKMSQIPFGFPQEKEILLDFSQYNNISVMKPEISPHTINAIATLTCPGRIKDGTYVWMRKYNERSEVIAFTVMGKGKSFKSGYGISVYGDLIIESVSMHNEGNYTCVSKNQHMQNILTLFVMVPPTIPNVVIDGCKTKQPCIIKLSPSAQGIVTCRVSGIRPAVSLIWSVADSRTNVQLTVAEEHITTISDLSTVSRTAFFTITNEKPCTEKLTIQCQAMGLGASLLETQKSEVILLQENNVCGLNEHSSPIILTIFLVVLVLVCVALVITFFIWKNMRGRTRQASTSTSLPFAKTERDPLMSPAETSFQRKKETLIKLLKVYYLALVNEDDPYIPNTVSKLDPDKFSSDERRFTNLKSPYDLFRDKSTTKGNRRIIEGDAGCGKSYFAQRMAYEWADGTAESPLYNIPAFILLSLTEFDKASNDSIYSEIKKQILPEDCKELSEEDISRILEKEQYYVLILDGFDEYSERSEKDTDNILQKILNHKIMANVLVYLMTRSASYLGIYGNKKLPIYRLRRFSSKEIDSYVELSFKKKPLAKAKMQNEIESNDYLANLCQIPLFLNMIADLFKNENTGSFPSGKMTEFFKHLLQCKYETASDKYGEESKSKTFVPSKEMSHFALQNLLNGRRIWKINNTPELVTEINSMVDMNIIKVVATGNDRTMFYKFSHDICRQYLAAMHFAHLSREDFCEALAKTDALTSQYLFIFSCGANPEKLELIVNHLLSKKDVYPFTLRDCICYCLAEATSNIDPYIYENLINRLCQKDHGMEILKSDSKQLRAVKVNLLNICQEKKITINILRLVNVVKEIFDGHLHLDFGRFSAKLPLIRTCIITDFQQNINDVQVMSFIKSLPTLKEFTLFSYHKPKYMREEVIQIVEKNNMFVIVVTHETNPDGMVYFNYPSITYRCWMTIAETACVMFVKDPETVLNTIVPQGLKTIATRAFLLRYKILRNMTDQEALQIVKNEGVEKCLDQVGFSKTMKKKFLSKMRELSDFLKEILSIWQRVDDSSTAEEVKTYEHSLLELLEDLKTLLRLYISETEWDKMMEEVRNTLKTKADDTNHQDHSTEEVWTLGKQNIVTILKPIYFNVQA